MDLGVDGRVLQQCARKFSAAPEIELINSSFCNDPEPGANPSLAVVTLLTDNESKSDDDDDGDPLLAEDHAIDLVCALAAEACVANPSAEPCLELWRRAFFRACFSTSSTWPAEPRRTSCTAGTTKLRPRFIAAG